MALTDEQKLDFLYQVIRKEKLDGERLSLLTTEASRKIGQLMSDFKISRADVLNLARPAIASVIYDLAEQWGLMDVLHQDFVAEQRQRKLAEVRG